MAFCSIKLAKLEFKHAKGQLDRSTVKDLRRQLLQVSLGTFRLFLIGDGHSQQERSLRLVGLASQYRLGFRASGSGIPEGNGNEPQLDLQFQIIRLQLAGPLDECAGGEKAVLS